MVIHKKQFWFSLVIVSLLPLIWVGRVPLVTYSIYLIKIAVILMGTIICINLFHCKKMDRFSVLLLVSILWLVLATIYNRGELQDIVTYAYVFFALVSLDRIVGADVYRLSIWAEKVIRFFVLLNFVFMLIKPQGIYQVLQDRYNYIASIRYNVLGFDNQLSAVLVPYTGLLLFVKKNRQEENKSTFIYDAMILCVILTGIISTSTTLKLLMVAFFAIFLLKRNGKLIFSYRKWMLIVLAVVLVVVVMQDFSIFKYIIENILGKSMTLSNRTLIWAEAMRMIKEKPILGYGLIGTDNYIFLKLSQDFRSAHDMYLQFALRGGIPYLLLNLLILGSANVKNVDESRKKMVFPLQLAVIVGMIGMLSEVINTNLIILIIYIITRCNRAPINYEGEDR